MFQKPVSLLLFKCLIFSAAGCLFVSNALAIDKVDVGALAIYDVWNPSLSRDGRYLVYQNGLHAYRYDRVSRTYQVVSSASYVDSNESSSPRISADGLHACFTSEADDLYANDDNGFADAFVSDIDESNNVSTFPVNLALDGSPADDYSLSGCAVSDGGRYVSFDSKAGNLVEGYDAGAGRTNLYLRDRDSGDIIMVNRKANGDPATSGGFSYAPSLTPDGRFIAFASSAQDILVEDTNSETDIFVYDQVNDTMERVSISSEGEQANDDSDYPSISADGRFVVFRSEASNLVEGDNNDVEDIFVHDRQTKTTERVSVSSSGEEQNAPNWFDPVRGINLIARPGISDNGRFVVFASRADNLVPNDENELIDIFVHDRQENLTDRVNVSLTGIEANGRSERVSISGNGHWIAFDSLAYNLIPGDENDLRRGIFIVANPQSDFSDDTDNDGVTDIQELIDGSDPYDRGSNLQVLGNKICSEWNGFFNGTMYNIGEHVNLSSYQMQVVSTLYDINGAGQQSVGFSIESGNQLDLLVHGMSGRIAQSYGQVCSQHDGLPGALDGRMVYYKTSSAGDPSRPFDFAFSMAFSNGKRGRQFVPFNTFQPSLSSADSANPVANWIQITNPSAVEQRGSMHFYEISGAKLSEVEIVLAPNERRDFSGHQFGINLVGIIEWRPENEDTPFLLRNVRYYYSSSDSSQNSFTTAAQFEGQVGNGRELSVPLDARGSSAILEIANTLNQPVDVEVGIYSTLGIERESRTFTLAPYASTHIITDEIVFYDKGVAHIKASKRESVIATAMHYGRKADKSIRFIYGIPARESLGGTLRGSYNSFIGQGCYLLVANSTASDRMVKISMTREDGVEVFKDEERRVWANGLLDFDLCTIDGPNNYGVITVESDVANSLVGTIVRIGQGQQYRFATELR